MLQIGKYRVFHAGGCWWVTNGAEIVGKHYGKWAALQEARSLNWNDVHEKKKPPVVTSGSKEPKI